MPPGEEVFRYHGYSGPCPKPIPRDLKKSQNPCDPTEVPTFLPGDKVRDKRSGPNGLVFRIVARQDIGGVNMLRLRGVDVEGDHLVPSNDLIPYLEMVAPSRPG